VTTLLAALSSAALRRHIPAFLADGHAACNNPGVDPDWFFPDLGGSYAQAKQVCLRCPLVNACADYAISTGEKAGMWGALTPNEIKAVRLCRTGNCEHREHWRIA
jgi:hypothetical protein